LIGIVLVSHGQLADDFISVLNHIVGPQKQVAAVCIGPEDDMERRRQDIIDAVENSDSGDGVALLTDMFGGTPSNLAISVMNGRKVEVIAGMNLPMLVKLASIREKSDLAAAIVEAQDAGRRYINVPSRLLCGAKG
jgi:PTS system mannose-specific IIA component